MKQKKNNKKIKGFWNHSNVVRFVNSDYKNFGVVQGFDFIHTANQSNHYQIRWMTDGVIDFWFCKLKHLHIIFVHLYSRQCCYYNRQ